MTAIRTRLGAAASLVLMLVMAGVATASVAATPAGGAVHGRVHNATTGAAAPGVAVQLVFIGPQGTEPVGTTRSGADGRFAFEGLPDGRYLLTARYQGISYAAHAVVSGGPVEVTVQVHDAATEVPLRVSLLGIAVEARQGYARVSEVVHLQNPTPRTFLGDVTFPLPPGARFVSFADGFHQPRFADGGIGDRLIVRPGSHQLAYMYSIGGSGEVRLNRRLGLPVDRLELFVTAPAEARSPRLQPLPSVTNEGQTYTRASGRAVPAGDLDLVIAGVPGTRQWLAPAAAGALAAALIVGLVWAVTKSSP
jgi:5-hydroxyisourate hydrolase-like protein (transthyretin family)